MKLEFYKLKNSCSLVIITRESNISSSFVWQIVVELTLSRFVFLMNQKQQMYICGIIFDIKSSLVSSIDFTHNYSFVFISRFVI